MTTTTHSHEDGFAHRSSLEYDLGRECPVCHAAVGVRCTVDGHANRPAHARRSDAGDRHWFRDAGETPYPEDREPGRCYSTLPGCE